MATQRRRRRNIPVSVNIAVDDVTLTAGVKAIGTLTGSVVPSNLDTVTIGGKVYTWQTTLTNVDGNVLIGGTLAAALTNLKAAINLAAGGGTTYAASTTAHTTVDATTLTGTTLQVDAKLTGTAGNAITTTKSWTNGNWGAGVLAGGVNGQTATASYSIVTQNGITRTSGFAGTWSSTDITKATVLATDNGPGSRTSTAAVTGALVGTSAINFATAVTGTASVNDSTPTTVTMS